MCISCIFPSAKVSAVLLVHLLWWDPEWTMHQLVVCARRFPKDGFTMWRCKISSWSGCSCKSTLCIYECDKKKVSKQASALMKICAALCPCFITAHRRRDLVQACVTWSTAIYLSDIWEHLSVVFLNHCFTRESEMWMPEVVFFNTYIKLMGIWIQNDI